ncbi:MAG: SUMF1/EgtB/PvdO family nonheme iron enzyme [Sedimentisphaerales bacterium]|nr:SUMF1/EgtB/PvdO family nonheme iron enzyme [Sedimentisphaerales bacterium]
MSRTRRALVCLVVGLAGWGLIEAARAAAAAEPPPKRYTDTVKGKDGQTISFDMVLIEGGTFIIGSPESEADRQEHEGPQHKVKLDSFYLCTTETTLALFQLYYQETVTAKKEFLEVEQEKTTAESVGVEVDAISGPTPVYGDMTMGYDPQHPAIGMTWHNAMTFCQWLSKKTDKKYRLPTEAEWEYACRAGGAGCYGVGDDPKVLAQYAWYADSADGETCPVAKKKPNAWGLYDMMGNVSEWVYDFYSPDAYQQAAKANPAVNPTGPKEGRVHVARGGDYDSPAEALRCAARSQEEPWWRAGDPQIPKSRWWLPEIDIIGFRVACTPPVEVSKVD